MKPRRLRCIWMVAVLLSFSFGFNHFKASAAYAAAASPEAAGASSGAPGDVYGPNLIPNSGFEEGAGNWGLWTNTNIGAREARTGNNSLYSAGGFAISQLVGLPALQPHRTYRFGFWYQLTGDGTDPIGSMQLQIEGTNETVNLVPTGGVYTYASVTFAAPPDLIDSVQPDIQFLKWTDGDVYIDDLELEKVSTPQQLKMELISPTDLHSPDNTDTSVDLAWDPPSSNDSVVYTISNGSDVVGTTFDPHYTVTGLASGTAYSFEVTAKAADGLASFPTNAASVTTRSPIPAPPEGTYPGQIGVGLEGIGGDGLEFVDAAKTARQWQGPNLGGAIPLDAQGWPTGDASDVFFDKRPVAAWEGEQNIDDPAKRIPNIWGTYHLSFTGQADLSNLGDPLTIKNQKYDAATNTTTADIEFPPQSGLMALNFAHTDGGVKNVKLIRPGYPANTKQLFTDSFLNALKPFSTLRLKDWLAIDSYDTAYPNAVKWEDRKQIDDATQAQLDTGDGRGIVRGAAWEYVIDLANATHKDIWINIPAAADDEYVTRLAELMKRELGPHLHIYVEYSNEVWNGIYQQQKYNQDAALDQVAKDANDVITKDVEISYNDNPSADPDPTQKSYIRHRLAQRLIQIEQIFAGVYGNQAINTTIRPVLSWFYLWPDQYRDMLDWVQQNFGDPTRYFYAIAGAPYFNASAAPGTASVTQILTALQADIDKEAAYTAELTQTAHQYGLKSFTYEGGVDTGGGSVINVANRIAANRDPRIAKLIVEDLDNHFFAQGGDLFMYFTLTSGYNRYGAWGLTEDPHDLTTPKYQVIEDLLGMPSPPVRLLISDIKNRSVHLSWTASADILGSRQYDVYVNDRLWTSVSATSVDIIGLKPGSMYRFTVISHDELGNASKPSNTAFVTTQNQV